MSYLKAFLNLIYNYFKNRKVHVRVVNDFYVTGPSKWPFLMSLSLLGLTSSSVAFFHYIPFALLAMLFFFICILIVATCWWWDLIIETQTYEIFTPLVQRNIKIAMMLFILSEVFFFFSFFWAFFHSSLSPSISIGCVWPPDYFYVLGKVIDPWDIALVNTAFLLTSGIFVSWAHYELKCRKMETAFFGLFFCLFCSFFFTGWQIYEYYYENLLLCDGIYGSCFFMLTGFHGLHVIGGTVFLIVCTIRLRYSQFHDGRHVGLDCAVWYWHFVDIVWIFLFISVYIWGNTPSTGFENLQLFI